MVSARLTQRGTAFALVAVFVATLAWWLGQRDFMRVAILLAVLPLASWLWVRHSGATLVVERHPASTRVSVGEPMTVGLRVVNRSRLRAGALLLADDIPPALGVAPAIAMDRLRSHGTQTMAYEVRPVARGRHQLGPLRIRALDPFGLASAEWTTGDIDIVLATPRPMALPALPTASGIAGDENRQLALGAWGRNDILPREHRVGDDIRRVHWAATARTGSLMVRREELSWRERALIVLDNRMPAFPRAEAFDVAVRVAASVAVALTRKHWVVRIVDAAGTTVVDTSDETNTPVAAVLDACAQIELMRAARLAPQQRGENPGCVIGVVGVLDDESAAVLRGWSPSAQRAAYVVVDAFASDIELDQAQRGADRAGWPSAVVLAHNETDDDPLPHLAGAR